MAHWQLNVVYNLEGLEVLDGEGVGVRLRDRARERFEGVMGKDEANKLKQSLLMSEKKVTSTQQRLR